MDELKKEYGLVEFIRVFEKAFCEQYLFNLRYNNGLFCPNCGSRKIYKRGMNTIQMFSCSGCKKKFNIYTSSIFGNTKVKIETWFLLIYLLSANKKNISSVQNGKNLGVTQTTAWNLLDKIRYTFHQEDVKLSGTVEIDEAFISRGDFIRTAVWSTYRKKPPVLGLFERETGTVVLRQVPDRRTATINRIISEHVNKGSSIYTDGWIGYQQLKSFKHEFVNHSESEFVRGKVHTNNIESVWAFFKRNIRNSHHSISNKHLQAYLNEGAFKWNNKHLSQMERFNLILRNCIYG